MGAKVTTWGLQQIATSGVQAFSYVAIGTGSTEPTQTDTALENELVRVSAAQAYSIGSVLYIEGVFPAGTGTSTNISEYGVFDAPSGGNLLLRGTFSSPKTKGASDAMLLVISVNLRNE